VYRFPVGAEDCFREVDVAEGRAAGHGEERFSTEALVTSGIRALPDAPSNPPQA
jgi:hypothetical protein